MIDVCKEHLDVCIAPNVLESRFANTAEGHRAIIKAFCKAGVNRIIIESTGGLERPLINRLMKRGLPVFLVQPARVRAYAKAEGLLYKNDQADARLLTRFGEIKSLRPLDANDTDRSAIKALATRRMQLEKLRNAEKCRRHQAYMVPVRSSIKEMIGDIDVMIRKAEKALDQAIAASVEAKKLYDALLEVFGVGLSTARMLTAFLPELGQISEKRLNALVGVAPFDNNSGTTKGVRKLRGGRKYARKALYACCIAGLKHTPEIKEHYKKLTARGLEHKTAMMSCIRKKLGYIHRRVCAILEQSSKVTQTIG